MQGGLYKDAPVQINRCGEKLAKVCSEVWWGSRTSGMHFLKPCHTSSNNCFYLATAFCNRKRWQGMHVDIQCWGKVTWEGSFLPVCGGYLEMYESVFLYAVTKMSEMIHFHFDLSENVGACCVFSILFDQLHRKKKSENCRWQYGVWFLLYLLNVRLWIFNNDQPKKSSTCRAHQLVAALHALLNWFRFTCLQVRREWCSCTAWRESIISL